MQSKISFFNKAVFKKNISRTWIAGLLYLIILLLVYPVSYTINISNFENSYYMENGFTKGMVLYEQLRNSPSVGFAFVIAIIVASITFWFLFFKRDNYMMHAFPVSRTSLFFTGVFSCLTVALAPVLVTTVVMTIVAKLEGAAAVGAIWYWFLMMAVATFIALAIAVFALMVSGQIVTAIIFYIIFNFLYWLMDVAFRITASMLMYGLSNCLQTVESRIFSPVSFMKSNCGVKCDFYMDDYGKVARFVPNFAGAEYLAIYAVAAVVIIAISFVMYKRKKLETVQDFIAVPFMKPVFSVGMSFFVSMVAGAYVSGLVYAAKQTLISYSSKFTIAIVSAIIIGIILFFATQMLIEKTVRVFSIKKSIFCCVYSLASLAVLLCLRFDAFKVEDKVPEAKDIAWVGIQCDYTMVFTDEDEINTVRSLHKNFLTDKKELRDLYLNNQEVSGKDIVIKYKLKNGDTIYRNYYVIDTESEEASAKYVAAAQPILDFLNSPNTIKEHIIGNIWDECVVKEMEFVGYRYDEEQQYYAGETTDFSDLSDREKIAKNTVVYNALLKDIDEGRVLQSSFHSDYNDDNLYDDFYFTITNASKEYFSDMNTFEDYHYDGDYYHYNEGPIYEQSINVMLNMNCTNTLKALFDEGFYTDEEVLLTYAEYNEKTGVYDDYYEGTVGY